MIDDLYRYNDWANGRILRLCDGLTEAQLDEPRDMGFGSLRATLFHILTAEQVWYERWTAQPWRKFPTDPHGMSLEQIGSRLCEVSGHRRKLMDLERSSQWQRQVMYLDSKRNEYANRLRDLLVHVANHGIHHRAQALHFLKHFGRQVPAGLDYVFFKLAYPTVPQDRTTTEALRQYGLEVETAAGATVSFSDSEIPRYFAYHDWATGRILEAVESLADSALDRDFQLGPGSIRKTLLHLHDVEPWWVKNWTVGPAAFVHSAPETPVAQLRSSWTEVAAARNAFVRGLDEEQAQRIVSVLAGGPPTKVRVIESLVQLCTHGTHHRAQLVNMLRQSGIQLPALDYVVWIRDRAANDG